MHKINPMINEEKIYLFLCSFFSCMIVLNNLVYQKFVSIDLKFHIFELSVGAVLYPLTFLVTDLIAEFFGKERANVCVRISIIMNIIVATIICCMDLMPAASWSKIDDAAFHNIFGFYIIAFLGSIIACYVSQTLDVYLYLSIKSITGNSLLFIRNIGSTAISLFLDTLTVVGFLTIFGILPYQQFIALLINSYSWKLFFTILSSPLFYLLVKLIKKNIDQRYIPDY